MSRFENSLRYAVLTLGGVIAILAAAGIIGVKP